MDRQTKNFAKELCGSSAVPSIILGNDMLCKFCNTDDFVSAGVHFSSLIVSDMDFILGKTSKTMVKIKDRIYCAVVTAVNNECYFCQLFDSEEVFSMAQLTDVYDNTIPAVLANGSQVDSVVNKLNRLVSEPSVKKNNKLCTELLEIINESGKAKNKLEELLLYCKLCFSKIGCSLFNLSLYVKWTIDKCNSFLLKSGRCIESLCMDEDLTVNAEYKYVVFSVIEMIQFSLLYSPIDVNPIVALAKNKGNIELTVTSRSSVFIPKVRSTSFLVRSREIWQLRRGPRKGAERVFNLSTKTAMSLELRSYFRRLRYKITMGWYSSR